MITAQEIIDEVGNWHNEMKRIKAISANTYKHLSNLGIDVYYDGDVPHLEEVNEDGGKNGRTDSKD